MSIHFTKPDVDKLKVLLQEGVHVMTEVDFNKAIKTAHKGKLHEARDDFDTLETILEVVGRTA